MFKVFFYLSYFYYLNYFLKKKKKSKLLSLRNIKSSWFCNAKRWEKEKKLILDSNTILKSLKIIVKARYLLTN